MKLKWKDEGIQSPLSRARGLGCSGEGTTHWIHQRVTAIFSIPLMLWLVWAVVSVLGSSYEEYMVWLAQPLNSILMILSVLVVFYHAYLGTQAIIEDYFHHEGLKLIKLLGIKFYFLAGSVACVFAVIKISLS